MTWFFTPFHSCDYSTNLHTKHFSSLFLRQTYNRKLDLVVQGWARSGFSKKRWDEVFWSFRTQIYQPSACVLMKLPNSENKLKLTVTYWTFMTGVKGATLFSSPKIICTWLTQKKETFILYEFMPVSISAGCINSWEFFRTKIKLIFLFIKGSI